MIDEQVEPDELDDWFGEDQEEDQSADATAEEEEGSSLSSESAEVDPDTQTPAEGAAEAAPDAGTSEQAAEQDDPYAWMEQLDPELKAHAEALAHQNRSNSGRVAALQSRLDTVVSEQEAQKATSAPRRQPKAVEDTKEDEPDEALDTFLEEYPTVAANVKKLVDAGVAKEREEILQKVEPLQQARLQEQQMAQRTALRENAAVIFNSAETGIQLEDVIQSDVWRGWLSSQPAGYQEFARNARAAEDATKVLEDFAGYAEREAYKEYVAAHPEETSDSPSDADQVAASRKQALTGTVPPSRSGALDDQGLGSYDEWFDHFVEADNPSR